MLGHEEVGSGAHVVVVANDWLGDTSIWDGARIYLDTERFTWVFADLRGYGRSRGKTGEYSVLEATHDILQLVDALEAKRFSIVGHSMSSLIALHLAQRHPERIDRVVALTPPPPTGMGVDAETLASLRGLANADDSVRTYALGMMVGDRLPPRWHQIMIERWRRADPEAIAGYVPLFAQEGLPHPDQPIGSDVLMVTGEHDNEPMRCEAISQAYSALCPRLVVTPLADSGHYPMSEVPPLLVAIVERWLAGDVRA